jgi:hypothetical protein
LFGLAMFAAHLWLVRLPYFWDEAGQFIPAALDLLRHGDWIPKSVAPVVHPPGVTAYLALFWSVAGFAPATTRCAMLVLGSFAMLAALLLAIELYRGVLGTPALLAAALLFVSPLFFAQSLLAQLDAPATLFTTVALLLFLQDRVRWSAAACVLLVLVKETGIVVPLVFFLWLARERRWRDAVWMLAPAAALAAWIAVLARGTGSWTGNPEFLRYNLYYPLHPARIALTFLRRIYFLFFAEFRWIGTAATIYAWRTSRLFHSRSWKIAWLMLAAHVAMLTVLGGAALERYLLPVMPILYTAAVAGLSLFPRVPRVVCSAALLAGIAANNFINPPYPFPFDNNLAFADFLELQTDAADYLEHSYPRRPVYTTWPMSAELSEPELGFVRTRRSVVALPDLTAATLASIDWSRVGILAAYSRDWDPPFSLIRHPAIVWLRRRFYGYTRGAGLEEIHTAVPFPRAAHFELRGQWVDLYLNQNWSGVRSPKGGPGRLDTAPAEVLEQ